MYQAPRAEKLRFESEEIMDLGLLLASNEGENETDNETSVDDLLNGLI